jgi:hypothetical protein
MAPPSPVPRLTDIIEVIKLIRSEMAGVTLQAFEPDKRKRWLVERGIEIISVPASIGVGRLKGPPRRAICHSVRRSFFEPSAR